MAKISKKFKKTIEIHKKEWYNMAEPWFAQFLWFFTEKLNEVLFFGVVSDFYGLNKK